MKRLIILRGPAGCGKTTVCETLVYKLGEGNTWVLDLDIARYRIQSPLSLKASSILFH